MKKVKKDQIIKARITTSDNIKLLNYLQRRGMNTSEWIREKIRAIRS